MAGLNVGDVLQVVFESDVFSQRCLNVLHYRVTVASTSDDYAVAAMAVAQRFSSGVDNPGLPLVACFAENVTWVNTTVQRVYPTRNRKVTDAVGLPGTIAADCKASNVAGVITKYTDTATRRGIGALHVGGVPETAYQGGFVQGDYLDRLTALANTLDLTVIVTLETTTVQPVLWSPSTPSTTLRVTDAKPQTTLRVMRRRTVGLGI